MLIPFSENKTDKHKNKKKVCVWGGQTNNPKQRIQTESSHGQEENEFRFGYILLLMFLNSMPIYVNKHCLQSQIVDHVNWILKDNFTANWMSTDFGIKDKLSPESDSLSIILNSSPFSLSLCLQHFIAYELQTQCLQGANILQCRRLLRALGWVRLDVNGVSEIPYCVYSLEFVHSSSSCLDEKQHKPMTSKPAKTPGWFQEWIPIMQSHVGRRDDSQWQLHTMCLWILDRQMDHAVAGHCTHFRNISQPGRSRIGTFQILYVLLK